MRAGEHKIARAYVLYREEQSVKRQAETQQVDIQQVEDNLINVKDAEGKLQPLNRQRLHSVVNEATAGLSDVEAAPIIQETERNLFDGIAEVEVGTAMVMSARTCLLYTSDAADE